MNRDYWRACKVEMPARSGSAPDHADIAKYPKVSQMAIARRRKFAGG